MRISNKMPAYTGMGKSFQNRKEHNGELTNEAALRLLGLGLMSGRNGIPQNETNELLAEIVTVCKKHGIEPKNLPISEQFPGKLSAAQKHTVFSEIFYGALSLIGKITVLS